MKQYTINEIIEIRKAIENGITTNHSGKMRGKWSFSTSKKLNKLCESRSKNPNLICSKCYAEDVINRYENLENKLARNTELITKECLPIECFPHVNKLDFRLESFGDIGTIEQIYNYFQFANANKRTFFVLWTKNPHIVKKAMETFKIEKPTNFRIIFSSCHLNKEQSEIILRLFPFIDKIFTVYTAEYAVENNITINCGGNNCESCNRCYNPENEEKFINEMLKQEQSKFKKLCNKIGKLLQIA